MQEQLLVCDAREPETPCAAGEVIGVCLDGVCLEPGCGNGVVEVGAGELCDDGGRLAGDGCAPDCRSLEVCGDGALAPAELCDDGNLVDRDGCDSRCAPEQVTWTTIAVAPTRGGGEVGGAFDEQRRVVVVPVGPIVWEWDGTAWAAHVTSGAYVIEAITYDTERAVVTGVGRTEAGRVLVDWDGGAWQLRASTGAPQADGAIAIVHVGHLASLLVAHGTAAYLVDTATGTWTSVGALPAHARGFRLAYDRARSVVVGIGGGYHPCCQAVQPAQTWEWAGLGWTVLPTSPTALAEHRLVFDGTRGRVLSIGGTTTFEEPASVTRHATVEAWDGAAWTSVTTPAVPAGAYAAAWYDDATSALGLTAPDGHTYELGAALVDRTIPQPLGIQRVATDPPRRRVIAFDASGQTWAWTDHWALLPTTMAPAQVGAMAFDPVRGAIVAHDPSTGRLWRFGPGWQPIGQGPAIVDGMAYDHVAQRMVLDGPRTWLLDSTSAVPRPFVVAEGPEGLQGDVAWDTSTGAIVGLSAGGGLYDMTPTRWVQTLAPGQGYALVSRLRAGGILLAPLRNPLVPAWLREEQTWRKAGWEPLPRGASEQILVVEREDGSISLFYDGALVREVRTVGAGAGETCAAGEDADGDGLAGCEDRDCWLTCTPLCPAAMSCAP